MPDDYSLLRRIQRRPEIWLIGVIFIVGAFFSVTAPGFLTIANFVDLLESYSVQAILALGLFVVLVSGGIDISFAATASVSQYVAAMLATQAQMPGIVCIGAGLLIGTTLGCLNAVLIHFIRITSIIASIAAMSVTFSFLMYFSGGKSIYNLPDWWTDRIVFWQWEDEAGDLTRITLPIVAMVVAALFTSLMMTRSTVGRQIYAMGGNGEAARRVGANIAVLHFVAYGFLGFMAGLAGLLQAHRVGESVPSAMYGSELAVLSAAVLGGASLSGGIGTVPGVLCGIVLLAMLQNGLNLLGISSYFFQIVIGFVILISTSITVLSSRKRRRHRNPSAGLVHG
jgi:simple sugar transport system permease protein